MIEANRLPTRNEAVQAMSRFSQTYEKFRQNQKLPGLQKGNTHFLQNRTLRLEPQYVYRKGDNFREDNGYVLVGRPQRTNLSQVSLTPDLNDRQTNLNLVGSLRRKIKGAIFDGEISIYPFLVFLPSTFFLIKANYEPASPQLNEFCWYASERWAFPAQTFNRGDNYLMYPAAKAAQYSGHPFYSPSLEEWGDSSPSADSFAQLLKVIFVPLKDGKYRTDGGEIMMASFVNLAFPHNFSSFEDYLSLVQGKMGLNLLSFLNYAK